MVRTGVPSTRFPTPLKGAGATDHCSDSSLVKTIAMIVATIMLCVLAVAVEDRISYCIHRLAPTDTQINLEEYTYNEY